MKTKEEFRDLMRERIQEGKWHDLFTAGGCSFFALVLHDELQLPLFYYESLPDHNGLGHVFVVRGRECLDYCGKRPIEVVAKHYAGWADVKPHLTSPSEINSEIKGKELGEELEGQIFEIAKRELARRRKEFL